MVELIRFVLLLYIFAIVGVVVLSWIRVPRGALGRVFVFLRRITDPVLTPVREVIPPVGGVLDLSPTIVLIVLMVLRSVI